MAKDLYILKYNNYYNRILKSENSLSNYLGYSYYKQSAVNFNKNDGVFTQCIINTEFDGDYVVVTGSGSTSIESRWFVIENKWNRLGQSILTLRRDLLVDFYAGYSNAPAFIEKGAVSVSDPCIYNQENMVFNQIKQSEYLIKDNYGYPWVIAYLEHDETEHEISYKEGDISYQVTIKANRPQAQKAPYDIIMIPTDGTLTYTDGSYSSSSMTKAMNTAGAISKALTSSGILYDIQLVPYFPADGLIFSWDLAGETGKLRVNNTNYMSLPSGGGSPALSKLAPILYPTMVSYTFSKTFPYSLSNTAISYKTDNCCQKIRLCSPNGAGAFEYSFSKTKSGGAFSSAKLYIHFTYKPYTPYIHVFPEYSGLYGTTFDKDQRGLYVGGDFSIPQLNDNWTAYEINNKSYQDSFDRQISHMEINQDVERIYQVSGIAKGVIGATAAGAMVGGPAGAIAAGGASAIGGYVDYQLYEMLRSEAIRYSKDMFGYSLQNIQAMPVTLAKIGSTTIDSKFFPFVEIYSASEKEINALKEKIKYNGMSVGRIGTFADFKTRASSACQYIKCQLIRATSISDDFHLVKELADELYKGVYIV